MNKKHLPIHIVLIVVSIISLFPFIWMIIGMTNTSVDVANGTFRFGGYLLENLQTVIENYDFARIFLNSTIIAVSITIISVFLGAFSAYGFEMFPNKNREKIFSLMMLTMMIPFSAIMIPLFKLMSTIGLYDSLMAVILPSVISVFLIFLFRQNFKTYPKELIAAARIDGANEFEIFFKVILPSIKNTISAAAIMSFMGAWNSYMWPLIILQSPEKKTIPLLVSSLGSSYQPDYGVTMLVIFLSMIPTLIIFFVLQKQFVSGMQGSVK